ncbi:MAG: hypothetical protein ABW004_09775, partial [Aeromicrobium sp.]
AGNAFAVDNLRLLDATPSLDVSFAASSVPAGTASTLTYTITNTTELAAKPDWSFTNTLPAGLTVAPTPAVGGTCTNVTGAAFTVTAAAGASSVSAVGGDLAAGATSCTVTVNVVSTTVGSYTVGPANISTVLVAPEAATLTVTPATTITVRKVITSRNAPADQFTMSLRTATSVLASVTTSGTATGLQAAQITRAIVQPGATYTIHEAAASGAGLAYGSSYECVRGTTVIAAGASPAGSVTMPPDQGAEIVCTFTNTPQTARLACDTNHFYSVSPTGSLVQGDIVTGTTVAVGSWSGVTAANALGVGAGGTTAYAMERTSDAAGVTSILKWTAAGGFQSLPNTAYTPVAGGAAITGSIVAGTMDLTRNRYVFGKYANAQFYLWSFTESNPAASRFAYLGSFPTGTAPNGNGDMAFDSRGNLYVLGASTVNNLSSASIFTISADTMANAAGGTLAVSTSSAKVLAGTDPTPAFGNVNGIGFSPRGTAYLSSTTSVYEFDPTTWTRIQDSPRIAVDSTDLAACTSPATVTLQKNVVGRAAASDQFQLALANGATSVATATTTGAATGRQAAQIGPIPVVAGTTLSLSETMAAGSASLIGVYTTVYECWADGVLLSSGATTSGAVTVPSRLSVNAVCTFFNSPRPASSITVTKLVLDPATGASSPSAGWTLGAAATATTGTATVLPSEAPQQETDAAGRAVWSVLYGSLASRATLTISEVQRPGFTFAGGTCTVNGVAVPVTFSTSQGVVSGTIANTQSASTVACTLTNRPVAALTLVKSVSFGAAPPTDWVLSATGPAGALPGPSGRTGTAGATGAAVTPGVPYRLAETGGSLLYQQSGAWQCVSSGGQTVPVTAAGDVTLAQGAAVTCTVVNATATLTVVKDVIDPQPGFTPSQWTLTATPATFAGGALPTTSRPGASYSAAGNPANTFDVRPGHAYTLSERPNTPGSRLAYRTLRLERLQGTTWVTVPSATITAPAAGQTAVYRFVNAAVQPTVLPLTGGMSSDLLYLAGASVLAGGLLAAVLRLRRDTRRRIV